MGISDKNILFVGPGGKGGIKAALDAYSTEFNPFKVVYAQKDGNSLTKFFCALTGYIKFVCKLVRDKDIKIVHIHSASNGSFRRKSVFIRIAALFNKKIVFHCHGGGFKTFYATDPEKIQSILDRCDVIVALSEQWESFFTEIGCRECVVIKNPVMKPSREETGRNDDMIHILFIGKICQQKGVFDILEMAERHKSDLENKICIHIAGNDQVEELKRQITDRNLENIVKYEGWISGDMKAGLFNHTDIFLLPSYVEGVPISILEAMSYGIPVIASDVGGIPSIVKDMGNGLLIEPGDTEAMFNAIVTLSGNKELREKMGKVSFELCKPYLIDRVKRSLDSLYNRLNDE